MALLGREHVMVAAFGVDMPLAPAAGVRGQHLGIEVRWRASGWRTDRPELATNRLSGTTRWRPYDFAVTYEPDLVIAAAQSLVQRMNAVPATP